jgi:hypothetical protein
MFFHRRIGQVTGQKEEERRERANDFLCRSLANLYLQLTNWFTNAAAAAAPNHPLP